MSLSSSITANVPFFAATVFPVAALTCTGAVTAGFATCFSGGSGRAAPRALFVFLPGFRYCRAVAIVMPRPTPLRSSRTVSRVCPAASASLAFARSFANASLREYFLSAGGGGIAMRPSNASSAAWIIASVITSLCAIKFLRAFPATRNICTVARCGTPIKMLKRLYL